MAKLMLDRAVRIETTLCALQIEIWSMCVLATVFQVPVGADLRFYTVSFTGRTIGTLILAYMSRRDWKDREAIHNYRGTLNAQSLYDQLKLLEDNKT